MMKFSLILVVLLNVTSSTLFASEFEIRKEGRLVFAGDLWCPYNCDPESSSRGALVELLDDIMRKHNIEYDYVILPWTRAVSYSRQGLIDGLIGAGGDDASHSELTRSPWLMAELAVLTRADAKFEWQGIMSLDGKKAVIIDGYEYAKPLPTWLHQNSNNVQSLSGEGAFRQAVNLVILGRRDVFFSSKPALTEYLYRNKLGDRLQISATGFKTPVFMAVSKKSPKKAELIKLLNDEFSKISATDRYRKVLIKYGL